MAYGKKFVYDIKAGKQIEVDLTPEEIAARDAERTAAEAAATQRAEEEQARRTDLDAIKPAQIQATLDRLEAGTATPAQVQQALALVLKALRHLAT